MPLNLTWVDLAFIGTKGYPGQVKRHSLPFQEEAVLKYLVVPLTFALDCTFGIISQGNSDRYRPIISTRKISVDQFSPFLSLTKYEDRQVSDDVSKNCAIPAQRIFYILTLTPGNTRLRHSPRDGFRLKIARAVPGKRRDVSCKSGTSWLGNHISGRPPCPLTDLSGFPASGLCSPARGPGGSCSRAIRNVPCRPHRSARHVCRPCGFCLYVCVSAAVGHTYVI